MDLRSFQKQLEDLVDQSGRSRNIRLSQIGSTVGSVSAGMQDRLRDMFAAVLPGYDYSRLLVMNPGDSTQQGPSTGYDVSLSLPVASDTWYLTVGASILPFTGEDYQSKTEQILGFLAAYIARLDNISPLRSIQKYADLQGVYEWQSARNIINSDTSPKIIREMRFETWMLNRSTEFPSAGPKASLSPGVTSSSSTSIGNMYCGLLSFSIGPLGVMEVVSLFSESMDQMLRDNIPFVPDGTVAITDPVGWKCTTDQPLDGLMSPMTDMTGMCPGVHLIEKGYLITSRDVEYPAEPFSGYDSILPLHSLRYYFRRDSKWPIPGEFIGLLAKPWPTHVWWFQKTSPILYSGNWFETNHFTSGIVTEIMDPIEGSPDMVYKCIVRGVENCIASSDFYRYSVGDRVAIIRLNDLDRFTDSTKGNFKWKEMEDLIAREKYEKTTPSNLPYIVNPNMMIVPMSFYQT